MKLVDKEINTHADLFNRPRGLNFGRSFNLQLYFVYASTNGICADSSEPSLL